MKKKCLPFILILSIFLSYCKKDNLEPPSSTISGRIVYDKEPLGLRSNGVQLELWQNGYQLFSKIPVYVKQDGTFSASVFDGNYKLTLLKGNGPWADKVDTINVNVNGSVSVDVPVNPFFTIKNETFQKNGMEITATFNLKKIDDTKELEYARVYIGQTTITDQNINVANVTVPASSITDILKPITTSINIPASLSNKEYVFARVGVKTVGVAELLYSQPQLIQIK